MLTLRLQDEAGALRREIDRLCPAIPSPPHVRLQLLDYQLAALYALAHQYNRPGARILEIGTGQGGSGYMLSRAAPLAQIISLTTQGHEASAAAMLWQKQRCRNVRAVVAASWEYLERGEDGGEPFDLVFIDGDHNRIVRDLPWFDRLREGGLLLCHDYSPQESRSPSAIVYAELNNLAESLGRDFDVRIVDQGLVGMAGFYRRAGEHLPGPAPNAGVVVRPGDSATAEAAARRRYAVEVSDAWASPWPRTLFVAPGTAVPWDLVSVGFKMLERWDAAVPFPREHTLAEAVGTEEERTRTRDLVLDLRVPVHAVELLFAGDGMGCELVTWWRRDCALFPGMDERLCFLRALAVVKPRLCVLPRVWLSAGGRAALDQKQELVSAICRGGR